MVTSSRVSFVSSREPWVYCASHYQLDRELRRLKDHFAENYGYTAAARIRDPNAFAMWLGIDFALNLNKTTDVKLGALDEIGYALSSYSANLWPGCSGQIDTVVHVCHGPVHYEDRAIVRCQGRGRRIGLSPRLWTPLTERPNRSACASVGPPNHRTVKHSVGQRIPAN